jgi:hypothetical protein
VRIPQVVVYVALRDSFHWNAVVTSGVFSLAGLVGLSAPHCWTSY